MTTKLHLPTPFLGKFNPSIIGFDDIIDLIDKSSSTSSSGFPPYNLIKYMDNSVDIVLAVAGFNKSDLTITKERNELYIEGKHQIDSSEESIQATKYIHKGIADRNFTRKFIIDDYVEIESAKLENGLLTIHLIRKIPDELKPIQIDIV